MTWETDLVGAQVCVNRAVFEMNKPGELPPHRRKPELRYLMLCIAQAHHHLMRAYVALEEKNVRPFSDREVKKWERTQP